MNKDIEVITTYDNDGKVRSMSRTVKNTAKAGISFGSCLAIVISYVKWQSIFWAIIHGILSWIYVIYYIIRY